MSEHDPPIDPMQDLIHLANEPLKLFINLLYHVNDTGRDLTDIAMIADALQQVASARIDASFQAVEEQIGAIRVEGIPEGFGKMLSTSQVTAILMKPQKSE